MNRLLLFVLLLVTLPVKSQNEEVTMPQGGVAVTMAELFKAMPDSLLPYLSQNNRLDLIDFHEARMEAKVVNLLDGQTRLAALTTDSLVLELNPTTTIHMYLLPTDESVDSANYILCMVNNMRFSDTKSEQSALCYSCHWRLLSDEELPTYILQYVMSRRRSTLPDWDDEQLQHPL